MLVAKAPQVVIAVFEGTKTIAEHQTLKGRFARPAAERTEAVRARQPLEREAWLLNCDWAHAFLLFLLGAVGILAWPLLWTDLLPQPNRTLGALFFLGVTIETLLIRSKLRAAVAMEIYGGIFLDRTGAANTPGPVVLLVVIAHGALTIFGSVLALDAIGENWATPTLPVIGILTIVVCRSVYIGFVVAAPSEGPGSGPLGAVLLELGGAIYVAIFAMLLWSAMMTDPNGWAIKAEGRPTYVQAALYCLPAVCAVLILRGPISMIERRGVQSLLGRSIRWGLFALAALAAISPVALLAI